MGRVRHYSNYRMENSSNNTMLVAPGIYVPIPLGQRELTWHGFLEALKASIREKAAQQQDPINEIEVIWDRKIGRELIIRRPEDVVDLPDFQ